MTFEIFASTGFASLYVLNQTGNGQIVNEVNSWNEEFFPSLEKMWKVYPQKPIYVIVTNDDLGLEMGNATDYPGFFRITITMRYPLSETKGTFAHELMHVFQFSWMEKTGKQIPLWVMEGLATWYGGKMGFYPSSLNYNPFLFQSVNPVDYTDYPSDSLSLQEYYAEVYSLFLEMNKKINFESTLPLILDNVELNSNWETAFSGVLGENFDLFYSKWRESTFYYLTLDFIIFWGIWIALPVFLFYVFLTKYFHTDKKENIEETKQLENIYGKEYWNSEKTKEELNEKSDGNSRSK